MNFKTKNTNTIQNDESNFVSIQTQYIIKVIELIHLFSSASNEDDILNHLINTTINLTQASAGSVSLFDPANQHSAKTLIYDRKHGQKILDHQLNLLLSGWVLKHNQRLHTNNLIKTYGKEIIKNNYSNISSALSIPLSTDNKIIGVINLVKTNNNDGFNNWHISISELLAALCTHFIVNNRLNEKLFVETERLRKETQRIYSFEGLIGKSSKMLEVYKLLEKVIPTAGRVVIEGESGTGKELVARILHYNGPLKDKPFVAVDCGALPANLLESELFGHVKGAFTGAVTDKKGLFEEADTGTLFLDEIVNMPLDMQSKLLRVIQENEFRPVGSTQLRKVNFRIIVAASCSLSESVKNGSFREDLFYRLNVVKISLPPLRDHPEDISLLANHILQKLNKQYKISIDHFDVTVMRALEDYHWPGNVRELENVIERMLILAESNQNSLSLELLPEEFILKPIQSHMNKSTCMGLEKIKATRDLAEKSALIEVLKRHNWNQSSAARELGIHESSIRYKMKQLDIKRPV